ncbi:MAG: hypothetical protein KIS68_05835 [Bauldia sp.]|nr:hypothetical protein [Bauldia sp.]
MSVGRFVRVSSVLGLALLAGCAGRPAIVSEFAAGPAVDQSGLIYYLPRGVLHFTVKTDAQRVPSLTYTVETVADTPYRYSVSLSRGAFSRNDYDIEVDNRGLLRSVNATITDETPDIIGDVVDIVIGVVTGVPPVVGPGAALDVAPGGQLPANATLVDVIIDPFSDYGLRQLNDAIRLYVPGLTVVVAVDPSSLALAGVPATAPTDADAGTPADCSSSFCFRLLTTLSVEIRRDSTTIHRSLEVIPDPASVAGYDVVRGACVRNTSVLTFSAGILTEVDEDRPSPVAGCLTIPLRVTRAILSAPLAALRSDVALVGQRKALLDAQLQLINSQQALVDRQNQLLRQQQQAPNPAGG